MPPVTQVSRKKMASRQRLHLFLYIIIGLLCLAANVLMREKILFLQGRMNTIVQKLALGGFLVIVILAASKFVQLIIVRRSHTKYKRYNLLRLSHLVTLVLITILVITFLFANWYAAAVSLGLISLVLGFALQTPISSFIGWIYIIIRNPYGIGDRIQVNTFRGDVIEIGYLDTTLWEFAGEYLTNDLPSGRRIRFPNSMLLQTAVFNYSWRDFNYIWNEIPFHVAYDSDLDHVEEVIKEAAKQELGPEMAKRVERLKNMIRESPIDEMEIKEYPYVSLRISPNTWVEATLTYLVPPKKAASIRSRIIKRVLKALAEAPQRTSLPKGNLR